MEKLGNVDMEILEGGVACIYINAPEKPIYNSVTEYMLKQLNDYAKEIIENDNINAVILGTKGRGGAGAYIPEMAELSDEEMKTKHIQPGIKLAKTFHEIRKKKRVISIWDGYSVGGDLEIKCLADYRIATKRAWGSPKETRLGAMYGWGGNRWMEFIGPDNWEYWCAAQKQWFAWDKENDRPGELVRIGAVDEMVDKPENLMEVALDVAKDDMIWKEIEEKRGKYYDGENLFPEDGIPEEELKESAPLAVEEIGNFADDFANRSGKDFQVGPEDYDKLGKACAKLLCTKDSRGAVALYLEKGLKEVYAFEGK